jgi:hypothetical protein
MGRVREGRHAFGIAVGLPWLNSFICFQPSSLRLVRLALAVPFNSTPLVGEPVLDETSSLKIEELQYCRFDPRPLMRV